MPYTTLASVPKVMTGPATVNILAAMPVTKPSDLKSSAGEVTALEKPVMGTRAGRCRTGVLPGKAQRSPAVLDGLPQHADRAADDKCKAHILPDGGLFHFLLNILLIRLRHHIHKATPFHTFSVVSAATRKVCKSPCKNTENAVHYHQIFQFFREDTS